MDKIELVDNDEPPEIAADEIEIVEENGAPPPVDDEPPPPPVEIDDTPRQRVAPDLDTLLSASPPQPVEPAPVATATGDEGEDIERLKYEIAKRDSRLAEMRAELEKLNSELASATSAQSELAERAKRTEAPWFAAVEKAIASGLALATYPDSWPSSRRRSLREAIARAVALDAEARGQARTAHIEFSVADVSTLKPTTPPSPKKTRGIFG